MGLMDIIKGVSNGPHGQPSASSASTGMSPITMGLLALLAYKAFKSGGPLGGMFGQAPVPIPGGPHPPTIEEVRSAVELKREDSWTGLKAA
jgi:hypothetical protein